MWLRLCRQRIEKERDKAKKKASAQTAWYQILSQLNKLKKLKSFSSLKFPFQLRRSMSQEAKAVSPITFLRKVQAKYPNFVEREQQCVGEFFNCTMSAISLEKEQLKQICPPNTQIGTSCFEGISTTIKRCVGCGNMEISTEVFNMINLPVRENLQHSIQDSREPKVETSKSCSQCYTSLFEVSWKISKVPDVLVLMMQRSSWVKYLRKR